MSFVFVVVLGDGLSRMVCAESSESDWLLGWLGGRFVCLFACLFSLVFS